MLARLGALGLTLDREPDGTFYVFAGVQNLPAPLDDGMAFFQRALDYQVIAVPGVFFDVNPGGRRGLAHSRFHQRVRLSFGPSQAEVDEGLDRLARMIQDAR